MELIDEKVYRLDIGDYYSTIEVNNCKIAVFGFSQKASDLLEDTLDYARRHCCGRLLVSVYRRRDIGMDDELIASVRS